MAGGVKAYEVNWIYKAGSVNVKQKQIVPAGGVLQVELGKRAGVPRARVFTTSLAWVGLSLATALGVGVVGFPVLASADSGQAWILVAVLPVALVACTPPVLTRLVNLILRVYEPHGGTIQLTAGDEFGRSQRGNNNAYAQDNGMTWIDWSQRDAGLELTDRVRLWIPSEDLLAYEDRIKQDTLAVSIELGELRLEKA